MDIQFMQSSGILYHEMSAMQQYAVANVLLQWSATKIYGVYSGITSITVWEPTFHPNLSPYAHFGHTFRYAGRRHGVHSAHTLCISHAFWAYHLIAVYESIRLVWWWITNSSEEYISLYVRYGGTGIRVRCGLMCVRADVFGMWKKYLKSPRHAAIARHVAP